MSEYRGSVANKYNCTTTKHSTADSTYLRILSLPMQRLDERRRLAQRPLELFSVLGYQSAQCEGVRLRLELCPQCISLGTGPVQRS
jgi:hypothetical protein